VHEDEGHQIGYKVVPRGTPVHASDGALVGTVYRVLDNAREHIFDGIVVKTPQGRRFVDAPEVARIAERRVTLNIDSAEAARLPPYGGTLAAVGRRTSRRVNRLRRR
jgi:hypothetical protein